MVCAQVVIIDNMSADEKDDWIHTIQLYIQVQNTIAMIIRYTIQLYILVQNTIAMIIRYTRVKLTSAKVLGYRPQYR